MMMMVKTHNLVDWKVGMMLTLTDAEYGAGVFTRYLGGRLLLRTSILLLKGPCTFDNNRNAYRYTEKLTTWLRMSAVGHWSRK